MRRITVPFNRDRQTLVFVVNHSIDVFKRKNKCWAYYIEKENRYQRKGLFGYIYLPRVKKVSPLMAELISHEVQHAIFDWILCRKGGRIHRGNEEYIATMTGEIVRRFRKKYG
jgi:hypothetical protein